MDKKNIKHLCLSIIILLIFILVPKFLQNEKSTIDEKNYSLTKDEQEILEIVKPYILENNTEQYIEALDFSTFKIELISDEIIDEYGDAVFWVNSDEKNTLEYSDYLVTVNSKTDPRIIQLLIIDTKKMKVVGQIPTL